MARHPSKRNARSRGVSAESPRGRRAAHAAAIGLLAASLGAACRSSSASLNIEGTVTIAPSLQKKALSRPDVVLFIIAKNRGGVPVAVRRVVNPVFPLDYQLGPEDMVVPGSAAEGPLTIQVEMNTSGLAGPPAKGDLEGVCAEPVSPDQQDVAVVIDRQA